MTAAKPAPAKPKPDPELAEAEEAGVTVEELRAIKASHALLWPLEA
jgi:hypothetical protein